MYWFKKAVYGMFFTFFLFIFLSMFAAVGINVFSAEFISITGLILVLAMGIFETNIVTYE